MKMDDELLPARLTSADLSPTDRFPLTQSNLGHYTELDSDGLFEYWRILQRRKGIVILIALGGFLLSLVVTLPQTPVYQSRTTLEIQEVNQEFMNQKQMNPVAETSSTNAPIDIQTQIQILQSESMIERALRKLTLSSPGLATESAVRAITWRRALGLPEANTLRTDEDLVRMITRGLKVSVAGDTRIIEILFDSTNRRFASEFANTLASEFIDQNMEARWQMAQRTSDWLGTRLDEMKVKLERSEDLLQAYASQNGLIYTANKQNVSEDKLGQLQAELSRAQADRVTKQSRYEIARSVSPETLADVLNDNGLRELQSKLTDLRRQQAELGATFTSDYTKVKRVVAQVGTLESAIERERRAIVNRIANDFHEALGREKLLESAYSSQAQTVTQDLEKSIRYNNLKREVDTSRQVYESTLQYLKESSIVSAMKASNVRVIDRAKLADRPYKPSLPTNGGVGLLVGGVFGMMFVVLRERLDRTIRQPGDAGFVLGLPELGAVPSVARRKDLLREKAGFASLPMFRLTVRLDGRKLPRVGQELRRPRAQLETWQNGQSIVADSFRAVLASVLFSGDKGTRPRVIVVTSPGAGEGKTTAASNLAIALSQIKFKVLLIDADLHKSSIHEIFELENQVGLSNLLKQQTLNDEVAIAQIRRTAVPNLCVLTSGSFTTSRSDLLFSSSMAGLLACYSKLYDMIIIDTPPVLAMPDARLLGRLSDGVLLVTRAGHTIRETALAASRRFAEDRTSILGVILNDWNPKRSINGYYGSMNRRDYKTDKA